MSQDATVQAFVQQYMKMGLCCVPLRYQSKKPDFTEDSGWTPWVESWRASPPSPDQVIDRFQGGVAICCGRYSKNMFAFDIDSPELAELFLDNYAGFEETTPVVKTSRGIHIWLRQVMEDAVPNKGDDYFQNEKGWSMQLLGEKHLVTAPPSIHPSGHRYSFVAKPSAIMEVDNALDWLHAWLEPFGIAFKHVSNYNGGGEIYTRPTGPIGQGGRHDFMKSECGYIARNCARNGYGLAVAVDQAMRANEEFCSPPLPDKEVEDIIIWAYRQEKGKSTGSGTSERSQGFSVA